MRIDGKLVVQHSLDYVRFKIFSDVDVGWLSTLLSYVDVQAVWYHGTRFVNLSGDDLALMRTFTDVASELATISYALPVSRIDYAVDVYGDWLSVCSRPGTVISNNGRVETIYSDHLSVRGDRTHFARAYDARAAGHYDYPVTRFECEFKRHVAANMLRDGHWHVSPCAAAMYDIKMFFGVEIKIKDVRAVEFNPRREVLEHDRSRFYRRYGRRILEDVESMGVQRWSRWVHDVLGWNDVPGNPDVLLEGGDREGS